MILDLPYPFVGSFSVTKLKLSKKVEGVKFSYKEYILSPFTCSLTATLYTDSSRDNEISRVRFLCDDDRDILLQLHYACCNRKSC